MSTSCACDVNHPPRLVVVTGGPGAGKTALLEVVQRELCRHVVVLPEAASLLWRGGFPRRDTTPARKAAQRAIVRVQLELQRIAIEEQHSALIVCDRGTLDAFAYWPGEPEEFLEEMDTTRERELARYAAVIQLRPPTEAQGYLITSNRPETAEQAAMIDDRINAAWAVHPRHYVVPSNGDFLKKLVAGLARIVAEVPGCCRRR